MRYKLPKNGEHRVIEKFLFFPKSLETRYEMNGYSFRWLEKARIYQTYYEKDNYAIFFRGRWHDSCWDAEQKVKPEMIK